ncbi:uncharacterized protein LOC114280331 [Camellia sinensis]|uniref:uncharacterized protein LOC114280331 n=1 Tax=Camellia sinensis TaxID=4442 RepID=UPI001035E38F|nr:uncharacterized protein LOC114280331 [Camellia sinensis]
MKPPRFQGGIELMKAEAWVLKIEKLFEIFPSVDAQKCSRSKGKTTEFQNLTQGNKTVAEYDRAFTELARYTPHMVDDEYRKVRKFESGLRGSIQDRVNMLNMPTYAGVLDKAILAEANLNRYQNPGESQRKRQNYDNRRVPFNTKKKANVDSSRACYECGEIGHRVKDCPKTKADDGQRNGSTSGSAQKNNVGRIQTRQGRVFALVPGDTQSAEAVVSGKLGIAFAINGIRIQQQLPSQHWHGAV